MSNGLQKRLPREIPHDSTSPRKKLGCEFSSKSKLPLSHAVLPANELYLEACRSRNPLSSFPVDVLSKKKLPCDESRINPFWSLPACKGSLFSRAVFEVKKFA